jgi:hypothetical protein
MTNKTIRKCLVPHMVMVSLWPSTRNTNPVSYDCDSLKLRRDWSPEIRRFRSGLCAGWLVVCPHKSGCGFYVAAL